MSFQELKTHGTHDFPAELYCIDSTHPKYEMAFHWHHSIELIRILQGTLTVYLNNRRFIASAGDLIFINCDTLHGAFPENCVYECFVFDGMLVPSLSCGIKNFSEDISFGRIYVNEFFPCAKDELHQFFNGIFDAMKKDSEGKYYLVLSMLCGFYGILSEKHLYTGTAIETSEASHKLKKVLNYIYTSYEKPITIYDMSVIAGLSPKYFCTYFKSMTGKSPMDYLRLYRIECASKLLINTDDSVTAIAFSSGFNDLSYFIKTFKKLKGISPRTFRKIHQHNRP